MKIAILDSGCNPHDFFKDKNINYINDKLGHGSCVASIVLQNYPKADVLNIKTVADNGKSSIDDTCLGIEQAIKEKVDIILMAMGGTHDSEKLHTWIKKATNSKILVISAVGNDRGKVFYPANYDEVLSVGATNLQGERAKFSPIADVYALGKNVNCVWFGNSWTKLDGTSLACAKIGGYALLIKENYIKEHGKSPTAKQLKNIIIMKGGLKYVNR